MRSIITQHSTTPPPPSPPSAWPTSRSRAVSSPAVKSATMVLRESPAQSVAHSLADLHPLPLHPVPAALTQLATAAFQILLVLRVFLVRQGLPVAAASPALLGHKVSLTRLDLPEPEISLARLDLLAPKVSPARLDLLELKIFPVRLDLLELKVFPGRLDPLALTVSPTQPGLQVQQGQRKKHP